MPPTTLGKAEATSAHPLARRPGRPQRETHIMNQTELMLQSDTEPVSRLRFLVF